jgi:hypothetical protein
MFSPDEALKTKVSQVVKRALSEKLSSVFCTHNALYGNFMVKEPGEASDWFVHQDWTYVDETKHESVAVWVPLVDLTLTNGVICVVPGSHRIENMVRGPGVNDPWKSLHQQIREQYHEKVFLKAGEALIWHHRLVHFSPANVTEKPRVAATLIYTPINVPVYHFWKHPSEEGAMARKYMVSPDFYMNYDIVHEPTNMSFLGLEDSEFPEVDLNRLKSFFHEPVDTSFAQESSKKTDA